MKKLQIIFLLSAMLNGMTLQACDDLTRKEDEVKKCFDNAKQAHGYIVWNCINSSNGTMRKTPDCIKSMETLGKCLIMQEDLFKAQFSTKKP